jgi:hypothetical protein
MWLSAERSFRSGLRNNPIPENFVFNDCTVQRRLFPMARQYRPMIVLPNGCTFHWWYFPPIVRSSILEPSNMQTREGSRSAPSAETDFDPIQNATSTSFWLSWLPKSRDAKEFLAKCT